MFAKLLKYDWRATGGTLGILSLAALGAGLLGGGCLWFMDNAPDYGLELLSIGLAFAFFFVILALIAYGMAVPILQLIRFYKSRFTDEGYLTFTLPVKSHQLFLSPALCMLIWTVISTLVLTACSALILLIGMPEEFWDTASAFSDWFYDSIKFANRLEEGPLFIVLYLVQLIISVPYNIVIVLTCITTGAVIAKKHKIVAAFLSYYVFSFVTGILGSILSAALAMHRMEDLFYANGVAGSNILAQETIPGILLNIACQLILMVAAYLLSTHLMKRKLNLP